MARRLPRKDAVIVGLGWTGSILAHELTQAGLDVVAIERGPWRDTATDFPISYAQDELRYRLQHQLFLQPAQTCVTFRNNAGQTALPVRNWGAFMLGNGVGGGGAALECRDLSLPANRLHDPLAFDAALRRKVSARGYDDPGLGRHLRRPRAALRRLRIFVRHVGHGRQRQGQDPGRRQSVRGRRARGRIRRRPRSKAMAIRYSPRPPNSSATSHIRNRREICRSPTPTRLG